MSHAEHVTVQMDNASPHTSKNSGSILNTRGAYPRISEVKISVVQQEPNSPETNANGLAFFPSMSARVSKARSAGPEQLVKAVDKCFEDYDPATLSAVFDSKTRVIEEIIKHKGNNHFDMPHRKP